MGAAKDLTRVAGLLSGSVAFHYGMPFSTALSMLIEELVRLCETSGNELSILKYRVDNIIIGDFKTAVEYVKQFQDKDNNFSDSRKIAVLNKANELFMKTYYRLLDDVEFMEYAALSAVYMGVIHQILDEKSLALKWFANGKFVYERFYKLYPKPETPVQKFWKTKAGKAADKVGWLVLVAPNIVLPIMGAGAAYNEYQKRYGKHADEMYEYDKRRYEIEDCKEAVRKMIEAISE